MNRTFGANIEYIWDGADQTTNSVSTIRLRFIDEKFIMPMLTSAVEQEVFHAICPTLQEQANLRFGKGVIHVTNAGVRAGSLEVWVSLITVGAVYTFFKDYEGLRKGVLLFVEDIQAIGLKLLDVVRKTYVHAIAKVHNPQQGKNRGTVAH